jgi:hypothetical protein
MRKITFSVCLFVFLTSQAQIKNDRGTFTKPQTGDLIVEMNATPNTVGGNFFGLNDAFLQNLSDNLNTGALVFPGQSFAFVNDKYRAPMLKVRYFSGDNLCLRAQFNLVNSRVILVNDDGKKSGLSRTGFAVAVGFEKHREGAERLSTYYGADFLVGLASASARDDEFKNSQSGVGIGLRGVAGFDYYFIPKVYLGVELNYGLALNNYGVVKRSGPNQQDDKIKYNQSEIAPFMNPNLRLGFRF